MRRRSRAGSEHLVASDSPNANYWVVFEDDGETAYFYACTLTGADGEILDALEIRSSTTAVSRGSVSSPRRTLCARWSVTGGLLGFLMAASYDLSQFGTLRHWTLQLTLVEPFIAMIMVAVAGAVVAAVLRKSKAKVAVLGQQ